MNKAIAFGGGGSKGSYQFGVWTALNEFGHEFQIATGTSIGSINAGFYVQHDYDLCKSFWENLSMDEVMVNGINLDGRLVTIAEEMNSVKPFLKSYLLYKGADITPFTLNLHKFADENKFFSSDINYALMTVKFPSLVPVEVFKKDIMPNTLADWINTSCACFPVFPMATMGGQSYIDGGYYDNVPVASAFKLGADEVYAVDLNSNCGHPEYLNHPFVKYIYPSRNLGSFMDFDHDTMMANLKIGYRDTYKFFGKLYGKKYTFKIEDDRKDYFELLAYRFMAKLSVIETVERKPYKIINKNPVSSKCTKLLQERLYYGKNLIDYFIAALEVCADYLHIDDGEIMDLSDFTELLLSVISESGFKFSSSSADNIKEIIALVNVSNSRHKRELEPSTEEILIMLSVFTALCE